MRLEVTTTDLIEMKNTRLHRITTMLFLKGNLFSMVSFLQKSQKLQEILQALVLQINNLEQVTRSNGNDNGRYF